MKLVDKAALVAEIERRRDLHYKYYMKNGVGSIAECKYEEDRDILSFLDTLEVKEVDFEKIWKEYFKYKGDVATINVKHLAKHFFELGMSVNNKAQKGEKA